MKTIRTHAIIGLCAASAFSGCGNNGASMRTVATDSYLLAPNEGDYMSVRHLVVRGSNEQIGYVLGTIARNDYGTRLSRYTDEVYAQARMEYFRRNWPAMADRMRGVARAYGVDADGPEDVSELLYDMPVRSNSGCSAIYFPGSITESGHPVVVRNYDYFKTTFSETQGRAPQPGEHRLNDRSFVAELNPTDGGYATLSLGGMNLLNPFLDVMNEKGLFITALVDPDAPVLTGGVYSGGCTSGVSFFQFPQLVASRCATVREAKREILSQHFAEVGKGLHWLICDAHGNATVFEIDAADGFVFTDSEPGKPFVVTNHHLHTYRSYDDFPQTDRSQEHNTFVRRYILDEALNEHTGKYTMQDMTDIIDLVLCSFADDKAAGITSGLPERTLWSHTTDLAEKSMSVRFYLGDGEPAGGTNHLPMRRSAPVRIAFGL